MKCPNADKNLYCNLVNTLYEREVPYYCHKIQAPNVITPCVTQGKVYLLNNDLTASVIRELNGKNFPANFNTLNGSECRKRIGCQKVRAEICPAAENLLSPHLTKLLCQLSAINKNAACQWAAPILKNSKQNSQVSCVELAILLGLLNALKCNNGPVTDALGNCLKVKLVEEILSHYMDTSCGRNPRCDKVHITELILPEVEKILDRLRNPASTAQLTYNKDPQFHDQSGESTECFLAQVEADVTQLLDMAQADLPGPVSSKLRELVCKVRSLTSPTTSQSRRSQIAGHILCLLNQVIARVSDNPPSCSLRATALLAALNQIRVSISQLFCGLNCPALPASEPHHSHTLTSPTCRYNVQTPDTCAMARPPPPSSCPLLTSSSSSRSSSSRSLSSESGSGRDRVCRSSCSGYNTPSTRFRAGGQDGETCIANACDGNGNSLDCAISQLKELKLNVHGPHNQLVGYVKSPQALCKAIFSDLKDSPYLRAHLFRPRHHKRKPKYHYIEIKSTDPCNPDGFFLEFVL